MFDKIIEFLLNLIDQTLPCYILHDYEEALFYRFGKIRSVTKSGFHWKIPFLDSYIKTIVTTDTMRIEDVNITTLDGKTATIGGEFDLIVSDVKKALNTIGRLATNGSDFKVVIERLTEHMRNLLLLRNGIATEEKDIKEFSIDDLRKLLELTGEAYIQVKYAVLPQLPLELVAVKWCVIDNMNNESRIKNKEEGKVEENITKEIQPSTINHQPSASNPDTLKQLINLVNEENRQIAALLRSCTSAVFENGTLYLVAPFEFHVKKLNDPKAFVIIEKRAQEILGSSTKLSISNK